MKQGYVPAAYADDKAKKHELHNRILFALFSGVVVIITILIVVSYVQRKPSEADLMLADAEARLEELEQYNEERNQMFADAQAQAQAGLQELYGIEALVVELRTLVDSNGNIYYGNKARVEDIVKQINNYFGTTYSIAELLN